MLNKRNKSLSTSYSFNYFHKCVNSYKYPFYNSKCTIHSEREWENEVRKCNFTPSILILESNVKKSNVSGKQLHADQRQTSFSRTIETHSRKYVGEISNAYFKALSRWRIWIIYRYSSRHLKSHEARPAPRPGNITFKCLTNERVTSPAFLFSCFWYRHQRRAMSSVATTLTTLLLSLLACLVHALPEFVIVPFCYSAF